MKIVFLNPPWLFKLPKADRASNMLGLLYLASVARERGHEVIVIDALRARLDQATPVDYGGRRFYRIGLRYQEIVDLIPANIDAIAIGAPFTNLFRVVEELSGVLKRARPRAKLVLGGGLPSAAPDLCRGLEHVDMFVIGEGEVTLFEYLEGGSHPNPKPGPLVLSGVKIEDLDSLSIPDRSMTDTSRYFDLGSRNRTQLRTAAMITSRGCPYSCHFCSIHSTVGRSYRKRSPESVLEEVGVLAVRYGVQMIDFEDDNMLADSDRALEIFQKLARYRHDHRSLLGCSFPNGVRIDKLSEEMLQAMVDAGTHKLVLPVEHGHIQIRKKMLKPLSDDVIFSATERASKLGLPIEIFVMIGYPDETDEIFHEGAKFMATLGELPGVELNYLFPQPYPGTKLRAEVVKKGYHVDVPDETLFCGIGPVITTPLFDHAKLDERRKTYDRVAQMWRHLDRSNPVPASALVSTPPTGDRQDGDRIVATGEVFTELPGRQHNGSNLTRCTVKGTAFAGSEMELSVFDNCDFRGADLSSWNAAHSTFVDCLFEGATLTGAFLERSRLRGVDLSGLDLTGADLTHCDLTGAKFVGANLSDAVLYGSRLVEVDLRSANLTGANLSCGILARSNLTDALVDRFIARDALLEQVDFSRARGTELALDRARLIGCRLDSAQLTAFLHHAVVEDCIGGSIGPLKLPVDYVQVWDGQGLRWVAPGTLARI